MTQLGFEPGSSKCNKNVPLTIKLTPLVMSGQVELKGYYHINSMDIFL